MNCPNCGNVWNVSKGSCSRCGFILRTASHPEQIASLGAAQAQTAYADARFNSQQEVWAAATGSLRGEAALPGSQPASQARQMPSMGVFPENKSSGNLSSSSAPSRQFSTTRPAFQLLPPLLPGTSLRSGRYCLQEMLGQESWSSGVSEASWGGRDFRYNGAPVMLYEVVVPDIHSPAARAILRTATSALLAAGRHPCIPTLQDVFNDQERIFFVFEPLEGESLQARLQRLGRPLSEAEAIAFCIQISELLGLLASQSPPLIHGRICPEHLYLSYEGSRCSLSGLSPIIATGVKQFLTEARDVQSAPYAAPEFVRGMIDGRGDLYALLATAYYAVTGIAPIASGGIIPQTRQFNAAISADFDAILAKGLHPLQQQRYQHPAELSRDLLAVRSRAASGKLAAQSGANEPVTSPFSARETAFTFTPGAPPSSYPFPVIPILVEEEEEEEEKKVRLPSPETLPPMREGNDRLVATLWLFAILLGLLLLVIVSSQGVL